MTAWAQFLTGKLMLREAFWVITALREWRERRFPLIRALPPQAGDRRCGLGSGRP